MALESDFYLVFRLTAHSYARPLSVRISAKAPALSAGEVAVRVRASLPNELFNRPQLQAKITVPSDKVPAPVIDAEVANNIAEVVKRELGVDLRLIVGGES